LKVEKMTPSLILVSTPRFYLRPSAFPKVLLLSQPIIFLRVKN
jgi:hypothetical protein